MSIRKHAANVMDIIDVDRLRVSVFEVVQCDESGYPFYTCVGEQGSDTTRVQSGTTVEHGSLSY